MDQSSSERVVLVLRPKDRAHTLQLSDDIAIGRPVDLSSYRVGFANDVVTNFLPDIQRFVLEHGCSALSLEDASEALVGPRQKKNQVERIVLQYIQRIGIVEELIIVDQYFFHKGRGTSDGDYPSLVERLISATLPNLKTLSVITNSSFCQSRANDICNRLMRVIPGLNIAHRTSDEFHDRFWINRTAMKGFLMGTSLNGMGKRYALIDRLRESDVGDIVNALESESLI